MTTPANPLIAANHVQQMANKMHDKRFEMVCNGLSVSLLAVMLVRELRDILREKEKPHRHYDAQSRGR